MSGLKGGLHLALLFPCTLLTGCGAGDSTLTDNDEFFVEDVITTTEDPFNRDQLMVVQIELDEEDFAALQTEGRTLGSAISACPDDDFRYTEFRASVTINGQPLDNVGIRKKGYLGSLSEEKPSFKLDFSEYQEGRYFQGLDRLTLNNNRQDPSHLRQCLAYDVYQQAGLSVPRCNWARVVVNGHDMGIYSHVESIRKPFLQRAFGDDSGNLYEAQLAEFGSYLNDHFQLKTNIRANDRRDLDEVAELLQSTDPQWLEKLAEKLDITEFIQLWAADVALGNWDSTSGNTNNYFMYHNPADDRFHFIPWGTDAAWSGDFILKPGLGPLYRTHQLAKRLYDIPAYRAQFEQAVADLQSQAAAPATLNTAIERYKTITASPAAAVSQLQTFINGDDTTPAWQAQVDHALQTEGNGQTEYSNSDEQPSCNDVTFDLALKFSASTALDSGTFTFTDPDGQEINASILIASYGSQGVDSISYQLDDSTAPETHALTIIGVDVNDSYQPYALQLSLESASARAGSHNLQGFANSLMLFRVADDQSIELIATASSGQIVIDNFDPQAGLFAAEFSVQMQTFGR